MIDNYNDITVGTYLDLVEILDDETMDEIDKKVEIVALLDGREVDVIYDLPLPKFSELMQKASFLLEEPKPMQVSDVYNLGGMKLESCLTLSKITTAQFIDYQTYIKDKDKLVELISVFLIPKGHKYGKGYDILEVQKVIRDNMPITQAMGLAAFFLLLYKALLKVSLTSSIKKLKKMKRKEKDSVKMGMLQEAIVSLEESGASLEW